MTNAPTNPVPDGVAHSFEPEHRYRREMGQRPFRIAFASIVVSAGIVRVVHVIAAKRGDEMVGDQIHYFAQAITIANGNWFEHPWVPGTYSALHAPLTALSLAPVSWHNSDIIFTQQLTMAVYGTAVVAGLGGLARLLFDRSITLLATAIAAIYANFWMNDGLIMSETLAAGGVIAVLVAVYRYLDVRSASRAAVIGLAIGIAGLARAELLLLGPMLMLPATLVPAMGGWGRRLGHLALAGLVAALAVSPWVVRNQIRFEDPTFMSTQDGAALNGANCDDSYGGDLLGFWAIRCLTDVDLPPGADESVQSAFHREVAIDYVSEHFDRVPVVILARLGRGLSVWNTEEMVFFNTGEGREPWASRIGLWQYWILAPLATYGLWRWPSRRPRWPLVTTGSLSLLLIIALYGIPRFRIAAEVGIVLCAAITADVLLSLLSGRWRRPAPGSEPADDHSRSRTSAASS